MTPLAPDYLSTLAAQIGSISAFFGGFAATFLALFLTVGHRSRASSVAVLGAALASVAFIVTVIATTNLIAALHPHAPPGAGTYAGLGRTAMSLGFLIGIVALLVSIGASGWTRSRRLGWATSAFGGLAFILILFLLR